MENCRMLYACCFWFSLMRTSASLDILAPNESIRDGETLVSVSGTFELGFFSPGNSKNRYLGIWYKNISPLTVVWVANREIPLNNTTGVLQVNDHGVLVLLTATNNSVWSSNTSGAVENPIAQLLDSGNPVMKNGRDTDEEHLLWQSFDYPCDTLLPGMKIGRNLVTGLDRILSSWRSADDPNHGEYTAKIDIRGYPQSVQLKGSKIKTRTGSWNGFGFTAYPAQKPNPIYEFHFILNEKEIYYEYQLLDKSVLARYILNPSGIGQRFLWTRQTSSWEIVSTGLADQCENYALCGAYSVCSTSSTPVCACLKGFVPKNQEEWNMSYWSNGCVLRTALECKKNDGFQKLSGMKLPDTSSSWFSKIMSLDECRKSCLKNCSCTAYANLDIRRGGSGCLLWFDNLIDMKQFSQGGQDIYIRLPASELDYVLEHGHGNFSKKKLVIGIAVGFIVLVGFMILLITKAGWKKKLEKTGIAKMYYKKRHKNKLRKEDMDLPIFDLPTLSKATDNFSSYNKLGEGGYGPVYKGTLIDGQELAVKRLSLTSGQGLEEFKNEVALIAKLQHRNLVKLLGCCIQGDEKMLIYEYMLNKSLDYFIFDQTRSKLLDWHKCYHIIGGIARGLLYLHQDSRLRIIHRDFKTSNILLDAYMNPKISDFGLARTFVGDQVESNTNRVVGTYGYMPPKYAVHGHFSVKTDVFSFGVIILEIVSGKKNRGFSDPERYLNLLGHAWQLWNEDRPLELIDELLSERCTPSEAIRCIHVSLLCVQQKPEDRPEMSSVVLMLNGEKVLPKPKVPGFYTGGDILESDSASKNCSHFSLNEMSLKEFEAR